MDARLVAVVSDEVLWCQACSSVCFHCCANGQKNGCVSGEIEQIQATYPWLASALCFTSQFELCSSVLLIGHQSVLLIGHQRHTPPQRPDVGSVKNSQHMCTE